ncbi:MAG TPA: diacylglycerol kinase family protein [Anaerolineales bacterium]|nr:diacylglycerol kinase family protein [Anaerolineales bacterium]
MKDFIRTRLAAFRHAFDGWLYLLRTQRNAWIHAVITLIVVILGFWLKIDRGDWVVIVIAIALVWLAEFLNTALEAVVDLASPGQNRLAQVGKDVGAAAVLIAAGTAVIVGLLVLGPPLVTRLREILKI